MIHPMPRNTSFSMPEARQDINRCLNFLFDLLCEVPMNEHGVWDTAL